MSEWLPINGFITLDRRLLSDPDFHFTTEERRHLVGNSLKLRGSEDAGAHVVSGAAAPKMRMSVDAGCPLGDRYD